MSELQTFKRQIINQNDLALLIKCIENRFTEVERTQVFLLCLQLLLFALLIYFIER